MNWIVTGSTTGCIVTTSVCPCVCFTLISRIIKVVIQRPAASECLRCIQCHVEKPSHRSRVSTLVSLLLVPRRVCFFLTFEIRAPSSRRCRAHSWVTCMQICCCSAQTGTVVKPHTQAVTPLTPPLPPNVFLLTHPNMRTPEYAIERIILHCGVPEVVSSSCLFPTISYFHTWLLVLVLLQDRFTFSGNTRSVVGVVHSKTYQMLDHGETKVRQIQ